MALNFIKASTKNVGMETLQRKNASKNVIRLYHCSVNVNANWTWHWLAELFSLITNLSIFCNRLFVSSTNSWTFSACACSSPVRSFSNWAWSDCILASYSLCRVSRLVWARFFTSANCLSLPRRMASASWDKAANLSPSSFDLHSKSVIFFLKNIRTVKHQ